MRSSERTGTLTLISSTGRRAREVEEYPPARVSDRIRVRSVRGARARRSSSLPDLAKMSISVSRWGGGQKL
jgi:hypothetical protein